MSGKYGHIWSWMSHYKYLIVVVLGVAMVGFLDDNSFMQRVKYELEISDLKKDIARYNKQNAADMKQLRELEANPKAIERIAREHYFMKADDEDIFILSTDEKESASNANAKDESTD